MTVNTKELLDQKLNCFELSFPQDGIAHLKLNRPEAMNSMNWDFWKELPEIIRQLDRSGKTRVLVVSSTGKHFTAGMDLSVFADDETLCTDTTRHRERFRRLVLDMQECFSSLETCRMPVIAAIHGGCIGAGVDMISACDIRYAVDSSFFTIEETNIGIMADLGTLQRLPKIIPQGVARELAYTSDRLSAQRARELGLVNEIFPTQEAMLEHVMTQAAKIAAKSPVVLSATKEAITYSMNHDLSDSLNWAAMWQASVFSTAEIQESVAARKQNRKPEYADLFPAKTVRDRY